MTDEDDGAQALETLSEIRRTRQLLDEHELAAVRAARRGGRSWAEIATMLGVTRQSAWERWNDLDPQPGGAGGTIGTMSGEVVATASSDILDSAMRRMRRSASVPVPELIGMTLAQASRRLYDAGLRPEVAETDVLPLDERPTSIVRAQAPEAGARLAPGSPVRLWLRNGPGDGGAGVREPRRPTPRTGAGRAMRRLDETSDEVS